ncbi:leucine-rich repeat domain-containing protein [uncultured Aquimarina sp.]|uniref:leucine-rich repeat domain-containing protein n=1 Tax=uncultured Aquimarina sp. TaxID=575652 RepID=UPI00260572F2|nr:leucine-rich repeat domain-containing protein [uncultured Aquimarina sp.]
MKIYASLIATIGFLFSCTAQVSEEDQLISIDSLKIKSIRPMVGEYNSPFTDVKQYTSMEEALANKKDVLRLYLNSKRVANGIPKSITELKNLEELVIRGGLSEIPEFISELKNLKRLYLDYNSFSTIPVAISRLKKLEVLSLSDNTIKQLPDFLGEIKSLKILNVFESGIDKLPESIGDLKNLRVLNISHTSISSLPKSLKKLKKLEKLDIHGTKIKNIPLALIDLPLSKLPAKEKEITEVDEDINPLEVTLLRLSNKNLKSIPEEIRAYKNLRELNISDNQIENIPEWIEELSNLETLDFTNNNIKKIPQSVYRLKKLRYLYCSSNEITFLSDTIAELKRLKRLSLHQTKIKELPNAIGLLSNLRYISFPDNITLPKTFRNLQKLFNVGASPRTLLENYEEIRRLNLVEINLSELGLTELPDWVLDIKSLSKLFLTGNNLKTLPDLSSLSNLNMIELCNNNLSKVPADSLKGLQNVRLYVYNNNIADKEDYDTQDKINALYPDLYIIFYEHNRRRHR